MGFWVDLKITQETHMITHTHTHPYGKQKNSFDLPRDIYDSNVIEISKEVDVSGRKKKHEMGITAHAEIVITVKSTRCQSLTVLQNYILRMGALL